MIHANPFQLKSPKELRKMAQIWHKPKSTLDVCSILKISPNLLRWRFLNRKYPKVRRDGKGKIYADRYIACGERRGARGLRRLQTGFAGMRTPIL